jgi:predicted pyridoxine 5'-phosphate oxidase superfamily flavin-nucleotide-binding protein
MPHQFAGIAFTQHVADEQTRYGSRHQYERVQKFGPDNDRVGPDEKSFIESRDSMYLATVSETGWPYVQFRGGPKGFLRVLDEQTLGFADFRGNRQYITLGNLRTNDRVALFLMDYPSRSRLKILGRAELREAPTDGELVKGLTVSGYQATVERVVLIHVAAFDWNCQQHITPRWTREEVAEAMEPVHRRVAELEAENAALRQQLQHLTPPMP